MIYLGVLVCIGIYLKGFASKSIENYFLAGRRLPWWALSFTGLAHFLDLTGTMVIVSFLYMLGPRGLFIEFRGGAGLVLVIMLLWTGKWHRRSGCMTGAEWMIYRFGDGKSGQLARIVSAVSQLIYTIGLTALMMKGTGLFLAMFLPFSPFTCTLIVIILATIYTMVSGFVGAVITDIFQSVIIITVIICISIMAYGLVTDSDSLGLLATSVTKSSNWLSSFPSWKTEMPRGYEAYQYLGLFTLAYFLRQVLFGMARGDDPIYFGARSDRECGKLTWLWTVLFMFRWPMVIGFAILGLNMVKSLFPDQTVLMQAAAIIREYVGPVDQSQWATSIASIINHPLQYPQTMITELKTLLGNDWTTKLSLVSFNGTVDAERIVPAVILYKIPIGMRGLILIALLAAAISNFNSIINRGSGYFTRDLYQRYFRPSAKNKELIYATWGICIFMAFVAFIFTYSAKNINDIWGWLMAGFWGGLLIPSVLRFHWWRFNGGGYAISILVGMTAAILQRIFFPGLSEIMQLAIMVSIGIIASIGGSYLTKPTEEKVLENFFRTTRPFGLWKTIRKKIEPEIMKEIRTEHRNDFLALPFTYGWQISMFLLPMQLMIKTYNAFWITFVVFVICSLGMYYFWYRNLPKDDNLKEGINLK